MSHALYFSIDPSTSHLILRTKLFLMILRPGERLTKPLTWFVQIDSISPCIAFFPSFCSRQWQRLLIGHRFHVIKLCNSITSIFPSIPWNWQGTLPRWLHRSSWNSSVCGTWLHDDGPLPLSKGSIPLDVGASSFSTSKNSMPLDFSSICEIPC